MRTILPIALLVLAGCTEVQERYFGTIEPERKPKFTIQAQAESESLDEACVLALQPAQLLADLYGLRIYNHEYKGIQLDLEDECECSGVLYSEPFRWRCKTHLDVRE